ncbi:endonuclease domain-containing protein [Sphingobium terrigena]|uniref:Endonuclease domain-containing protein n=2 Tax=Sphingobium terrigena TaxID=2304063 RepID=A0A418YT31_9SPHN|nr:endonuclease domain-containing protein [Sphingobium terrigena]
MRNTARAKQLRNGASFPERMLWDHLRNRQLAGYKFSRQIPIGPYFADFLCREARLVIELDGDTHGETADYDSRRDEYCRSLGFEILRFSNADVMGNLEGVLSHIGATLTRLPTPNPSRLREGDE